MALADLEHWAGELAPVRRCQRCAALFVREDLFQADLFDTELLAQRVDNTKRRMLEDISVAFTMGLTSADGIGAVEASLTATNRGALPLRRMQVRSDPAFGNAIDAAEPDEPLTEMVADPARRPRAEALLTSVRMLEQLAADELPDALGLAIGFNALDGD